MMTADLERELATYRAKLPELTKDMGKFVLIHGEDVVDVYDTYAEALSAGYERFSLDPFLVKQITPTENVLHFTRGLAVECR